MPMVQGSVNDAGVGDGFAKIVFDILFAAQSIPGDTPADAVAAAQKSVAGLANGISEVIGYIQENADTTTLVSPLDAGLQAYTVPPAPPSPTTPNLLLPSAGQPLTLTGKVL
jgi:hypothetical protein